MRGKPFHFNNKKVVSHDLPSELTLDRLKVNAKAVIKSVGGTGQLRRNLLDMGLTPSTTVMVRKVAPMGDPLEICLRGYELTLRRMDAKEIIVEETTNECNHCNHCNQCRSCGKPQ